MRLPLSYYPDPVLRKKCTSIEEINQEILDLAENLVETMIAENGIGLAAPQVNSSHRIFVMNVPKQNEKKELIPGTLRVFINPEILEVSEELMAYSDGCLSIPGIRGLVERPMKIKIKAKNLKGEVFVDHYQGLIKMCPNHGQAPWLILQTFYKGLT